jgi:hypothetical protein
VLLRRQGPGYGILRGSGANQGICRDNGLCRVYVAPLQFPTSRAGISTTRSLPFIQIDTYEPTSSAVRRPREILDHGPVGTMDRLPHVASSGRCDWLGRPEDAQEREHGEFVRATMYSSNASDSSAAKVLRPGRSPPAANVVFRPRTLADVTH